MARPNDDGVITCTGCNRELEGTVKYFHRHRDAFKARCKECRGSSFGVHDYNKVMDTPEGEKICNGCLQLLPADTSHFHRQPKNRDGFTSQCKKCRSDVEYGIHRPNKSLDIPEGMWFCSSCEQILPLNNRYFYERTSRNTGFETYCKPCSARRRNEQRRCSTTGISGLQWRFIKANWLEGGVIACAYCGEPTPHPEQDHVQPISTNGDQTFSNIVPACQTCNRSKGDSPVTEWYPNTDYFKSERWNKLQTHLRGETPVPEE